MMTILALTTLLVSSVVASSPKARELDQFSTELKLEDGELTPAAPQCEDGWHYYSGHCYYFSSVHTRILKATEKCNEAGATLADVMDQAENDFIKGVLMAINPKDGTDYWLGAIDYNRDGTMYWLTGKPLTFSDWKNDEEPAGKKRLHMNFDNDFQWDTKDDGDDRDNGFVCKKPIA